MAIAVGISSAASICALPRPLVRIACSAVLPATSRIALSATAFTASSGSRRLNRYFFASAIRQVTLNSMSTMFSSPVSIRLSSGRSPGLEPPTSMRFRSVTGAFSARSIGKGMW